MEDKYKVKLVDKFICYYKNDKLHREIGPAVFLLEKKEEYFYLADQSLYHEYMMRKEEFKWGKFFELALDNAEQPGYYLDGIKYDKIIWDSLIEKKELNQDLINELPKIEEKYKKPKI